MSTRPPLLLLALTFALLTAGSLAAQGPGEASDSTSRVRLETDSARIAQLKSSPNFEHWIAMAQELRALSEARLDGRALPETTTDELLVETTASGMTRARLGVSQLNTAIVRVSTEGQLEESCNDGASADFSELATAPTQEVE